MVTTFRGSTVEPPTSDLNLELRDCVADAVDSLPEGPLESLVETSWEHIFDLQRPQNDSE